MSDLGIAGFFKKYGGQRLNVADNQPMERGMSNEQLHENTQIYQQMIDTGLRPNGAPITAQDRIDIERQLSRFRAELSRRG